MALSVWNGGSIKTAFVFTENEQLTDNLGLGVALTEPHPASMRHRHALRTGVRCFSLDKNTPVSKNLPCLSEVDHLQAPLLVQGADDPEGSPVAASSQGAGVAVGQNGHLVGWICERVDLNTSHLTEKKENTWNHAQWGSFYNTVVNARNKDVKNHSLCTLHLLFSSLPELAKSPIWQISSKKSSSKKTQAKTFLLSPARTQKRALAKLEVGSCTATDSALLHWKKLLRKCGWKSTPDAHSEYLARNTSRGSLVSLLRVSTAVSWAERLAILRTVGIIKVVQFLNFFFEVFSSQSAALNPL